MMDSVSLPANLRTQVRELHGTDGRQHHGCFLVEGVRACEEVLDSQALVEYCVLRIDAGDRARSLAEGFAQRHVPIYTVGPAVMERLCDVRSPQDLICVPRIPNKRPIGPRLLVLEGIQDPGNLGTLLRTFVWFGGTDVVIAGGADPWQPKVVRSAAGSLLSLNIERKPAIDDSLLSLPHHRIGGVVHNGVHPDSLQIADPIALFIGSEAFGLSPVLTSNLHTAVTIPGGGAAESLNAAVAGAILCYALFGRS
jgi:RNA methyltransferase, TrmH family